MGMIINIDEALKQRTKYNVLREPLHEMMKAQQEEWEKKNPIDLLFNRGTMSTFTQTFSSNIGFDHAFTETGDFQVGPIFNTAEGFTASYFTKTFQGGFVITQQTLEDAEYNRVKDDASAFVKRWHGDIVEYCMQSLLGGFAAYNGNEPVGTEWVGGGDGHKTMIKLRAADTSDGDINTSTKNALFHTAHKTVKVAGRADPISQSNLFFCDLSLTDDLVVSKMADVINKVITNIENYKDDNGKLAGISGQKTIVCANDPRLVAVIRSALETDMFKAGSNAFINLAYNRAKLEYTPYLNDVVANFATASAGTTKVPMFFIVDKAYMAANHGLEFTERIPFTLDVTDLKRPSGIAYDGRQRFGVNCASWRGITAVFLLPSANGDVYLSTTQILDHTSNAASKITPEAVAFAVKSIS